MAKSNEVDDWVDIPVSGEVDDWEDIAEPMSGARSLVQGAGQGATFGHADEITAGLYGAIESGKAALGMRGDIDFEDAYRLKLEDIRAKDKQAEADNPAIYKTAEIAGGVAPAFVGAAPMGAGRIAANALAGGAAAGSGYSEGEAGSAEHLVDTGIGGALGIGTAGALAGAGKLAQKAGVGDKANAMREYLSNKFRGEAERRAVKAAVGNQAKYMDPLTRVSDKYPEGRIQQMGRDLLDTGTVGFGQKARGIADNALESKAAAGEMISEVTDEIDALVPDGAVDGTKIYKQIMNYVKRIDAPNNEGVVNNLTRQAESFRDMGRMSMAKAQKLKNSYKWDSREPSALSLGKEASNELKTILGKQMDDAVSRYGEGTIVKGGAQFGEALSTGTDDVVMSFTDDGSPVIKDAFEELGDPMSLADKYQTAKQRYGTMATASEAAEKLASRQEKNRTFSLTDYALGGSGFAFGGNPVVAGGLAIGNKLVRERGSSTAAVGLDKLSNVLRDAPQTFGPYASRLAEAASKSQQSLGAMHHVLWKNDPKYRALFNASDMDRDAQ